MVMKIVKKGLALLMVFGLFIAIPTETEAATKVMWGKQN